MFLKHVNILEVLLSIFIRRFSSIYLLNDTSFTPSY